MKVLLINPPQWHAYGMRMRPVYPSLGLLQLAACAMDAGHSVRLIDADAEGVSLQRAVAWVRRHRPDVVGITATTPAYPEARRWAAALKTAGTAPVVLGGSHASALPQEVLDTGCFDFCAQGESEKSFIQLLDALNSTGTTRGIPGIWSVSGPPPPSPGMLNEAELNALPVPAWRLLKAPTRYHPPDASALPVGTMAFTRGCPGRCRFCQAPRLAGRVVRYLKPDRIVNEAWEIHRTMGVREIHIMDDCFSARKPLAMGIAEDLAAAGPPVSYVFGNGIRSDMLDRELLTSLKRMNVRSLGFGVETADPDLARSIGKPQDQEAMQAIMELARSMGFDVWAFFMLGLPGETEETLRKTRRLSLELPVHVAKFEVFKPYPGTELYDELRSAGAITTSDWAKWGIHTKPVHTLASVSARRIMRARTDAILRFYLRPATLLRLMPRPGAKTELLLHLRAAIFLARSAAYMR